MDFDLVCRTRDDITSPTGQTYKPCERHLRLVLATYQNSRKGDIAWPSVSRLAKNMGYRSDRQVQKIIRSIEAKGGLKRATRRKSDGRSNSNSYKLLLLSATNSGSGEGEPEHASKVSPVAPEVSSERKTETTVVEQEKVLQEVWQHYLATFDRSEPSYTLTASRRKQGTAILEAALHKCRINGVADHAKQLLISTEAMKRAIDNYATDDYRMARGKYQGHRRQVGWEQMFGSLEKFEEWVSN